MINTGCVLVVAQWIMSDLVFFVRNPLLSSVCDVSVHYISIWSKSYPDPTKFCFRVVMYVEGVYPEIDGCLPEGPKATVLFCGPLDSSQAWLLSGHSSLLCFLENHGDPVCRDPKAGTVSLGRKRPGKQAQGL